MTEFKRAVKSKHGGIFNSKVALGLIVGRTGAGKSQLLFNLLTVPGVLDYNQLYIYTPTTDQSLYQFLYHGFNNDFSKEAVNYLYNQYEDDESLAMSIEDFCNLSARENPSVREKDPKKRIEVILDSNNLPLPNKLDKSKKNVIIFDDCVTCKSQYLQKEYFIRGRHNSCTVFYLTQRYYDIEKIIRDNANIIILFRQPDKSITALINSLDRENANKVKLEAMSEWKKPYGYIAINTDILDEKNVTTDVFSFL